MDDLTIFGDDLPGSRSATPPPSDGNLGSWGAFRFLQKLGEGAFGEVYRAWDPTLQREVAVKLLLRRDQDGTGEAYPEAEYRAILREARAIAKVRHANIVSVYGVDRHDGRVGFWSDFIRGQTLTALLDANGPFSPGETAHIGIELCRALGAIHLAGLLHRDIKTSNVMREEGGRILLMDFGLSHDADQSWHRGGTLAYMAPELLRGQAASIQSDIYALGVLLYNLSTGKFPPRPDENGVTASRTLLDQRPDLPSAFAQAVETAIDPDPARRYPSTGRMSAALSRAVGVESASTEPAPLPKTKTLKRTGVVVLVAMVLLVVGLVYVSGLRRAGAGQTPAAASAAYNDYNTAAGLLVRYDMPGNVDKAIDLFKKAVAADPRFALAHAGLAQAHWRQYLTTQDSKWIDEALADCNRALAIDAQLATVQVTLGSIHVGTGRLDLGLQELQQAQRLDPRSAEVYAALSDAYRQQDRGNEVLDALQKAVDLAPRDWRWPSLLGAYLLEKGNFDQAESQYRAALALAPDNSRVLYNLGAIQFKQGAYTKARETFEQAAKTAPTFRLLSALGTVFLLEGDYRKAVEQFMRCTELTPSSYVSWGNLGAAYQWGNEKENAKRAFARAIVLAEEALQNNPADPTTISYLGGYYATVGEPDKSLPLVKQALALAPANPDVVYRAAESFELLGKRKESLQWMTKALDLGFSPDYVKRSPELAGLRADSRAPQSIRNVP